MDWKDIRWFYEVAKSGSFSAVARKNQTTQATISRRIKSLENDLGHDLFIRGLDGCELTDVGLKLEKSATQMNEAYTEFIKQYEEINTGIQTIIVTCGTHIGVYLSKNIGALHEGLENVEIQIRSTNQFLDLEKGEADLALRNKSPSKGMLKSKKLKSKGYGSFAVFGGSKFYKKRSNSLESLKKEKWISLAREFAKTPSEKWIKTNIGEDPIKFRMNSSIQLLEAAKQNKALFVLPRFMGLDSPNLFEVYGPIQQLEFDIFLVRRESSDNDLMLRKLMKNIEDLF